MWLTFLTEAGSGCLAGPGQRWKYTESECCWEAGWHLVGYTSERTGKRKEKERGKMVRGAIKMSAVNFTEALSRLLNHSVLWWATPSLTGRPSGLQLVSEVQAVLLSSRHSATNLDTEHAKKELFSWNYSKDHHIIIIHFSPTGRLFQEKGRQHRFSHTFITRI